MDSINNRINQSIVNFPAKVALMGQGSSLTYLEMDEYIEEIMQKIRVVCSEQLYGKLIYVYMHSSFEAIISQFAVIRSGAICVPLDRQTPLEYYALENTENVVCMITDGFLPEKQMRIPILQIESLPNMAFENTTHSVDGYPDPNISQYSHCILTSGTTGKPKAILLKQDAVLNQVDAKIQLLKMNSDSKVCLSMGLSFVASIWQIYATIFVGGTLIVLDGQSRRSPYDIFKKADENHASILCTVPSVLQAYLMVIKNKSRKLDLSKKMTIVLTGEILYTILAKQFYKEYDIPLINAYGQTECSDDTFHYLIPKEIDESSLPIVPIGYPIENIKYSIVDESGKSVNKQERGELCISGKCLAEHLIDDSEYTEKSFRETDALGGIIAFYTGDVVEQLENNAIVCCGRLDNQIKLHGYRIEPEAIEVCCFSYYGIRDVLVIKEHTATDTHLKLFYVQQEGIEINTNSLREYLTQRLPNYMIPSAYEKIDCIQYNEHGKKVRSENPKVVKPDNISAPKDNMRKIVEIVYKKNIGRPMEDSITLENNFLSLLNSIEFISLVVGLEEALNIEFDDDKLLFAAFPTLNDLINYLLVKVKILNNEGMAL
jgi:acyl-coenzyme A synthetase/AMP-(fatty) acid ligase/acyl carrier protein